jgi:uroporphyrinogen-III synthase
LSAVESFIAELTKEQVDYVVFMSVNGIRYLFSSAEKLRQKNQLKKGLEKTVTMAVGPKTAQELKNHNIDVGLVPAKYSSEGIRECFKQQGVSGKSVYIPRTRGATPELANSLRKMGVTVQEVYVYESVLPQNPNLVEKFLQDLAAKKIDAIIFGSSLSARNLFQMLKELISKEKLRDVINSNLTIVAIGPVTAETLLDMGLRVDVMPKEYLFKETLNVLACYWAAN